MVSRCLHNGVRLVLGNATGFPPGCTGQRAKQAIARMGNSQLEFASRMTLTRAGVRAGSTIDRAKTLSLVPGREGRNHNRRHGMGRIPCGGDFCAEPMAD